MAASIIILTGKAEWPFLRDVLKENSPELRVAWAPNGQELEYTCGGQDVSTARLISFCSSVIVRPKILNLFQGPAYNFHPGPPDYRGMGCVNFALYENSTFFGSTAHLIDEKIDHGKIINIKKFKLNGKKNIDEILSKTYKIMFNQAIKVINDTIKNPKIIKKKIDKNKKIKWSNKIGTLKDLNKLLKINKNIGTKNFIKKISTNKTLKFKSNIDR